MIYLRCLSLFVALFTGVSNNLCRRKCVHVTQVLLFLEGRREMGLQNVDFVRCIIRSGHVAYMRLIKGQSKYLSRDLKISHTWDP